MELLYAGSYLSFPEPTCKHIFWNLYQLNRSKGTIARRPKEKYVKKYIKYFLFTSPGPFVHLPSPPLHTPQQGSSSMTDDGRLP